MTHAEIAILVWIPVAAGLFAVTRPVRALVLAYLIGWLVLPMTEVDVRGFWDIDKVLATNVGVAIGAFLFSPGRLKPVRFVLGDWMLLAFVGGACITSISNDLGVYDGLSSATHKFFYYAGPYFFGRLMIRKRSELLDAARMIVTAACVCGVLAVWEWRMSPQIHRTLWGFFQHTFLQHMRWGFYRPILCFPHALGLGAFMAWTTILALSLYLTHQLKPLLKLPPELFVALPALGLAASMSLGPWGLAMVGIGILLTWRRMNVRKALVLPVAFAFIWMAGRYTGVVEGSMFSSAASEISTERAGSLQYRIDVETKLIDRAKDRPVLGWGGWGRNRPPNAPVATDGMWVIWVGTYGLWGLATFFLWWCWPVIAARKMPRTLDVDPVLQAILIAIGLQAVNFLFNNFLSPILTLMNGAAMTALVRLRSEARARRRQAIRARQNAPLTASSIHIA